MTPRILIVEDDTSFAIMLCGWAKRNGYEALHAPGTESAQSLLQKEHFDLVITDLRLPDGDGIMLLTSVMESKKPVPVIIMTGYAEVSSAVSAIKLGAFDYLEKPINPAILKEKIDQALEPKQTSGKKGAVATLTSKNKQSDTVMGRSTAAQKMYEHIRLVAPTNFSVLITGESGTGKEYAARMIHQNSKRSLAPFLAVDCGSLSKELAPSELFGHLKGSFTSAIADKKGVFEMAHSGTVFLDEVGNLPYDVQVQLLRSLQEHRIRPVGSAKDIEVDVRIIVATNENLEKAIAEGRFREDLYHRLNEFSVEIPPLRDRLADIPLFAEHFLQSANAELDKEITGIADDAMEALRQYRWSGNLRELKNVIRRAALFTGSGPVRRSNLPEYIFATDDTQETEFNIQDERSRIEAALKKARGNKSLAAKLLKVDRKTLYNKMHLYDMEL